MGRLGEGARERATEGRKQSAGWMSIGKRIGICGDGVEGRGKGQTGG